MAYNLTLGTAALAEIQNASDWYANVSQPTFEKFLDAIDDRLLDLSERPESFTLVRLNPNFRRVKLRRFPYLLIFRVNPAIKRVFIAAFIHEKRNPTDWARKLR